MMDAVYMSFWTMALYDIFAIGDACLENKCSLRFEPSLIT